MTGLGPVQPIRASMSLHHVGDEVARWSLGENLAADGCSPSPSSATRRWWVLPDELDVGRPGVRPGSPRAGRFGSPRCGDLPGATPSGDLPSMMRDAGLEVVFTAMPTTHMEPPFADALRLRSTSLAWDSWRRTSTTTTSLRWPSSPTRTTPARAASSHGRCRLAFQIVIGG
jgi:hypothetical protein